MSSGPLFATLRHKQQYHPSFILSSQASCDQSHGYLKKKETARSRIGNQVETAKRPGILTKQLNAHFVHPVKFARAGNRARLSSRGKAWRGHYALAFSS